ncbi:MAG TPA: SRPBCC family protein [Gemmatimonadaceae bacterium]|nr:SRPBCC family protein [Gemmatimonadaceae bacterium]
MSKTYDTVIDIRAASDRVLAILSDVERWPEWTSTMTSIRRLDAGPFRVGSRARVEQSKLKPAVWRVTELDDTHFTWTTSGPGIRMTARHDIEPTKTGSRVTLSLEFSGLLAWLAVRVAGELAERYIAAEAAGLKKRSES